MKKEICWLSFKRKMKAKKQKILTLENLNNTIFRTDSYHTKIITTPTTNVKRKRNLNCPYIPDHPCRLLIRNRKN